MHMADALLSPAVGAGMWAVSAGAIAWCSRKVRDGQDERQVPLMGVMGAFVFAAQMINFAIPGTGSSGHIGGGLLLALLLGPHAAFLVIASVLVVQALFFADGGLLALGCNMFNMGIIPAFLAYPLIYRPLAGRQPTRARLSIAATATAVVAAQLGALGVVLQTTASGISELPFAAFAGVMLPIHLPIGVAEGVFTAAVVSFISKANPGFTATINPAPASSIRHSRLVPVVLVSALIIAGLCSRYASALPDGLDWSIRHIAGAAEPAAPGSGPHAFFAKLQEKIAPMPDYSAAGASSSVAGIVGAIATMLAVVLCGAILRRPWGKR
ncbi:MAG: energy-coupling factor ABC transporter permease [Geobacter sp.]|nr:energy-coupling factor ABC transporter permease [Geobacter sp.]